MTINELINTLQTEDRNKQAFIFVPSVRPRGYYRIRGFVHGNDAVEITLGEARQPNGKPKKLTPKFGAKGSKGLKPKG